MPRVRRPTKVEAGARLTLIGTSTPAALAGLEAGDRIVEIDGHPVEDLLDLRFYMGDDGADLVVEQDGTPIKVRLDLSDGEDPGWEVESLQLRTCKCDCIFCFVDQQPQNLRPALYLKDEDYRFSFLFGNYLTLVGLSGRDLERIFRLRLSPLYVSIHATDPIVRGRLLGLKSAPVLSRLRKLIDGGIEIHGQIVLVPGMNDDAVLAKSLAELSPLYPGLASLSVVPVGLTRHRDGMPPLQPLSQENAVRTLEIIGALQEKMLKVHGIRWVYPADELLLRTGAEIPPGDYYEDYPQIENGVGLIRKTLDDANDALDRLPAKMSPPRRFIWVTGRSAHPFLGTLARTICSRIEGLQISVLAVENRLLGDSVTVAGLLCGADIKTTLDSYLKEQPGTSYTKVFLPPDCTNPDGKLLDEDTVEELSAALGLPVEVFDGSWERMFAGEGVAS